ncbi:MAG: Gfo/Idh/MocA family oxidoreductase [Sphaerochaeta sp.]|nr:Gfo/Idh/MocA family oxidoreductase [Sphaerochaeta sp.]
MKTIRWGIIGCGDVTERKSGPGFQKAEGSSLVAVMRRDGEKAADYAKRHNVPRSYDDAQKLIDDPEVDAIYIATPPNAHMEYTLKAAEAGKPVYCEKPLGMSSEESRKMVAFCKERNVKLFSAYYRRALPKFLKVKALLDSGAIGEVRYVHLSLNQSISEKDKSEGGSWRVRPEISGGGLILDVGSHALDLLDWFVGPIKEVEGFALNQSKTYAAEDIVSGSWKHEHDVLGTGVFCFNTYKDEDKTIICGSKGEISYSVFANGEPILIRTEDGEQIIEVDRPPEHIAQPMIQTVVNELLGKGICLSTGESGSRTDWVMDKLQGK